VDLRVRIGFGHKEVGREQVMALAVLMHSAFDGTVVAGVVAASVIAYLGIGLALWLSIGREQ
jgi:hypothetical protein